MSIALLALTALMSPAQAGFFFDSFDTTPFVQGSERWCERWHDVTWDFPKGRMEARGQAIDPNDFPAGCAPEIPPEEGHSCCPNPTCDFPDTKFCSTTIGSAGILYTEASMEPTTAGETRFVSVAFGLPSHLTTAGEHLAILPITHPRCHSDLQAIVAPDFAGPPGSYRFSVALLDEPAPPQFMLTECGQFFSWFSASMAVTLSTSTIPRYYVQMSTEPYPPIPGIILIKAELFDTIPVFSRIAFAGVGLLKPVWYNTDAKRMGFGGQLESTLVSPVEFDNFAGYTY